jgi:hypothetical protein
MPKLNVLPLHARPVNAEPFRPSSHSSICRPVTTGTPRAWADATIASDMAEGGQSPWTFAVNAP